MQYSKALSFVNHQGLALAAKLEFPRYETPKAYAIFAHCFTCNKNLAAVRNIARALTQNGIAVLRFDFAGLGDSEGAFEASNFSTNITDILAAADYLESEYEAPSLIIGHSLGGTAALVAASKLDYIKGVTTIGSPADPAHVTHLLKDALEEIKNRGSAEVNIAGRSFNIAKHFLDDLAEQDVQSVIRSLRKALLILHSPQDLTVGVENARMIYQAALHPKSFISLDGADHILSDKVDSLYVGQVIAAWASRYLSTPTNASLRSDSQVVASLKQEDKYTTHMMAGVHPLTADEPASVGGDDYGPSPYAFISAGLAACTAMTLHMYARRKKWDLQEVQVHVDHEKIYAEDCETCLSDENDETKKAKIDHLTRSLEIKGDLDETQRARLLEIANRCPVHRTLENRSHIVTKLR